MRVESGAPFVNPARDGSESERRARRAAADDDDRRHPDQVEISLEARDLQAGKSTPVAGPSPAADARTTRILGNLESGFYDSSKAIESLADELMIAFGL